MDQILEECEGCIGIADDITIHGNTEAEHDAYLLELMEVSQKYGFVFNPKKTQVKAPVVKSLDASMMSLDSTQIQRRLMLYILFPHQLTSQNFRNSLAWSQPLHSWSFHPDCSPAEATQEGC